MRRFLYVVFAGLCFLATAAALEADTCPADLDGNGLINLVDLRQVLDNAGSCPAGRCPEDLNDNDVVGEVDAYTTLGAFHAGLSVCTCRADLTGDSIVDVTDVDVLVSVLLRDCRSDVDRSGFVHDNDLDIVLLGFAGDPDSDANADVNDDGVVNLFDILGVLDNLGLDCRADLNGDGWVDVVDYAKINTLLGPCS